MNNSGLILCLEELREVIAEERKAAKALNVDEMLALTERKEDLLRRLAPMVESVEHLDEREKELARTVSSENLRNAYFFWSALKWVRQSVTFINDQISPVSYSSNGSSTRSRHSGALLYGRV